MTSAVVSDYAVTASVPATVWCSRADQARQAVRDRNGVAQHAAHVDSFRFHDLRHSTASYLAQSGASLLEIADVLGHKSLAMTKRYSHLTKQTQAKLVRNVLGGIGEQVRAPCATNRV